MADAPHLLFLCTGNYYRSRFAEEYWNARARQEPSPWIADSRALGVTPDPSLHGAMSVHALLELARLGIQPRAPAREPLAVQGADFARCALAVALDRDEHLPMVRRTFPSRIERIRYWDIGDVWKEAPPSALSRLVERLEALLRELREPAGH